MPKYPEDYASTVATGAKEKGIKHVLIDEKVARLQAKVFGLEVIGTLGLLLKAKKNKGKVCILNRKKGKNAGGIQQLHKFLV